MFYNNTNLTTQKKYGLFYIDSKNMNFISKTSLIDDVAKNTKYNDEKEIERNEQSFLKILKLALNYCKHEHRMCEKNCGINFAA